MAELIHLMDAAEKLFFHTIYSVSKLIDALYFVLIYTQKGLFQWPSLGGGRSLVNCYLLSLTLNIFLYSC